MLIQIDIDSTLYDANTLFYEVGTKEFGINWPQSYSHWFQAEEIGTDLKTLKTVFKKCHSKEYVLKQKPYPWAAEELARISMAHDDVELAYVSDRNTQQNTALKLWLKENGFLVTEDEIVLATKDKREWMRENRPDIVVDDRVRTILLARYELNAQVLTLEHPYNVNLKGEADGIYVAKDWKELGHKLEQVIEELHTEVKV